MYTEFAVVVGIVAVNLPFVVLTLQVVLEGIERPIEEATAHHALSNERFCQGSVLPTPGHEHAIGFAAAHRRLRFWVERAAHEPTIGLASPSSRNRATRTSRRGREV